MPKSQSGIIRRTILYSGTVQGVGFRYTTQATAMRFEVTGFVRNLADGRVELVAEGTKDELDRLQLAVADAMGRYITAADAHDAAATREFGSFDIAF